MAEPAFVAPDITFPTEDYSRHRLLDLFKEVRLLMRQQHAIEYRLACLLRELDKREHVDGHPIRLTSWLADTFGIGFGTAREKVRTARALGHLPLVDAAFREGKLSYSKVRAITRVARDENEGELVGIAHRCSTDALERAVQRIKQQERMEDVQEMIRQRSLTCFWDEDGSLVVKARLTPEQGAIWIKALEKADTELAAEEDFEVRQADAMTHALEESLNDRPRASQTGDRYQVVVNVSAETLCTGSTELPALVENGPALHPETVRRLTCDGSLVSVLKNRSGEVLNIGRKTRVLPSAIRRALKSRDQHCQFPGCRHTRYVDGHHIVHWADGGETKLDNLVLLCRRHHRYVHEFGYVVEQSASGLQFIQHPT